jgi:hypothetical protein
MPARRCDDCNARWPRCESTNRTQRGHVRISAAPGPPTCIDKTNPAGRCDDCSARWPRRESTNRTQCAYVRISTAPGRPTCIYKTNPTGRCADCSARWPPMRIDQPNPTWIRENFNDPLGRRREPTKRSQPERVDGSARVVRPTSNRTAPRLRHHAGRRISSDRLVGSVAAARLRSVLGSQPWAIDQQAAERSWTLSEERIGV